MIDNYGNMPAQLLDRIGWRHLELGGDFESTMTMFSAFTLNSHGLHSDNITTFVEADLSVLDVIIRNTLRQLVLHSTSVAQRS